jgi:hypothetical protein
MKHEHKALLLETLRRMDALAAFDPPTYWLPWDRERHEEQVAIGPRYGFSDWFGDQPNHVRQRFLRAIYDLQAAGLLVASCRYDGGKMSNVLLTAAGVALARSWATETAPAKESL